MNDEQSTSGKPVNLAAESHAQRQVIPDVDTTPPVTTAPAEPPVTEAPPETTTPAVTDDIAEQMAEAATTPPVAAEDAPAEQLKVTDEPATSEDAPADGPSQTIQNEINSNAAAEALGPQLPKVANPARSAIVAAIFMTALLAALAVFAFMSSQK